ncbi:MAG: hypothetical protein A2350_06170 [Candidatus Raymondbacteria bacterium RifOxyB12_full_50_8]|nr:MAG: hypothetical protein A2350_06170 [Candidatus Raymondbacteria bacterium RifOxyB12_full_50_8]
MLLALLKQKGWNGVVVIDGRQAVEEIKNGDYDAVLMDIQMPVLDGFGAVWEIRHLPLPKQRIPVVALSGDIISEDLDKYSYVGMDGCLPKPYNLQKLMAVLEPHIKRYRETLSPLRLNKAIFDKDAIMKNIDGDVLLLKELLELFLQDYPLRMDAIRTALKSDEFVKAANETHSLKGALANLGATIAKEHAAHFELLCRSQARDGIEKALADLSGAIEEFAAVIRAEL